MFRVLARRPVVSAVVLIGMGLIIGVGTLQVLGQETIAHQTWPEIAFLGVVAYAVVVVAFLTSGRGAALLQRRGKATVATGLPGILALIPVVVGAAAGLLGAATWTLWLGLGVSCVLLIWWAVRARRRTASSETIPRVTGWIR